MAGQENVLAQIFAGKKIVNHRMLLTLFAVIPFLLCAGIIAFGDAPRWLWLVLIGVIISAEVIVIGKPSESWNTQQVISLWALGIFLPWSVIGSFILGMPSTKKKVFVQIGLPILYFFVLVIGLVAGDVFGLIPQ